MKKVEYKLLYRLLPKISWFRSNSVTSESSSILWSSPRSPPSGKARTHRPQPQSLVSAPQRGQARGAQARPPDPSASQAPPALPTLPPATARTAPRERVGHDLPMPRSPRPRTTGDRYVPVFLTLRREPAPNSIRKEYFNSLQV